jgi:hypothetical protein
MAGPIGPICYVDTGTFDSLTGKVSRWSYIPKAQQSWQQQDIINTLDDQNKNYLIPLINALNEEFFVQSYDYPIPPTGWSGVIPIPSDSIGLDLRDVWAAGGIGPNMSGSMNEVTNWAACRRVNPNQFNYPTSTFNWLGAVGPPYYVENNVIKFFVPNGLNTSTGFTRIRFRYFKKPSTLCSRFNCAQVVAIDPTLNTITLDITNTALPFTTGMTFDFLQQTQPYIFDAYQITPINVVTTSLAITLSINPSDTTTITSVEVGDLCCPTGTAPLLQYMPEEANAVLCQSVVCRIQDSQGNETAKARADKALAEYQAALQRLLTPKIADQMKVIVSQGDLFSTNASFTGSGNYAGGIGSR